MEERSNVEALRRFLETQPIGPIADPRKVARLLSVGTSSMAGTPPPCRPRSCGALKIRYGRHRCYGSPSNARRDGDGILARDRASLASELADARRISCRREEAPDPCNGRTFEVNSLGESLAVAIIEGKPDDRLRALKDGSVKIDVAQDIPTTNKTDDTCAPDAFAPVVGVSLSAPRLEFCSSECVPERRNDGGN